MKLVEIVGQNIAKRRKQLGLSPKELPIIWVMTQDALDRMEKRHIAPKISRLEKIAIHLQCTVLFLFRSDHESLIERAIVIVDILDTVSEY